jgi:hypothetical protein
MKRISLMLILIMATACGSATFEGKVASSSEIGIPEDGLNGETDNGNNSGNNPGDTTTDPGGVDTGEKVPVRLIVEDPTLLDQYPCPDDATSVQICHFPPGSDAPNTQCIGKPAVYSHVDHYQEETDSWDYLGACR